MKKFILLFAVVLLAAACDKENERTVVSYRVSNAYSETEITYRINNEQLAEEWIEFESGEDIWTFNLELQRGEIVYLSARYQDPASSVKLQIIIDGRIYKEGSSTNEPEKYLIVSGTIPYN